MENKEQLNQNPATEEGKEENTRETVETTEATSSEKVDNETAASDDNIKQVAENVTQPTNGSVIDEEEKLKLLALISTNHLPETTAEQKTEKEVSSEKDVEKGTDEVTISKAERNEIAELIASNQTVMRSDSDDEDDDEDEEDDKSQIESLNKLQLVEMLEEAVQELDVTQIKSKVAAIKVQFLKLNKEDIEREYEQFLAEGGEKEAYEHADDPLEVRFKAAFNQYKENKAHYNEQLEKQKQINFQEKLTILEELKQLIASEETLKKTYDEFKVLQDKWRDIGPVPAGEINNLWNNYHFLVEKFFDKVKINRELRDLDMKKNLEAKIELCEKAEELLLEKSVVKSFKLLQQYHDEWKEIGPVPQDKKDEIWDRFKNATDQINQRRREHYAQLQEELEQNYEAKVALCENIEDLITNTPESIGQWQNMTKQVSELFNVWKSIGQAPKKLNDEIWKRFKGSMDSFFNAKKEYFGKLKEQQLENYNLKLDLCAQAESMQDSSEWRNTTNALIKLQEDWKKIGPVPRKHSDKIWKRFRAACDKFFKRKSEFFSNIRENESENLEKKRALIKQIISFEIQKEKSKNLDALKSLQRQWMEIGHVPIKLKDQLQAEYRKALDSLFEKMKVSEAEMTTVEYEGMVESMKDRPDGRDHIRRERNNLNSRISKLREEILLWENNIGFFANSKQADIMKAEYEKKIKRAKNDLKIMEAKLRVLRD